MTVFRIAVLPLAALMLAAGTVEAQERSPIATGRPSFASGPGIVPSLQVEAGYQASEDGPATDHAIGQVTVRVPVLSWIEVRTGLGSLLVRERTDATTRGVQDVTVGTKVRFLQAGATGPWFPAVALIASTSLPTASEGFGAAAAQPAANVILAWPLGDRAQLLSNSVVQSRRIGDERIGELAQGVFLGYSVSGRVGSFVEVFGSRADGRDLSASAAAGLTLRLTNDFQLDVHGGRGLTDAAADRYVGVGLGWRR